MNTALSPAAVAAGIRPLHRVVAGLLLLEFLTVLVPVMELGRVFHFPDILRQPAEVALPLFRAHEGYIVALYGLFLVSSLLCLPLAVLLPEAVAPDAAKPVRQLSVAFGVAAGVFQVLGFSRWLALVPLLAHLPDAAAAASIYDAANRYLGATVGEFLGFVAMAVWTFLLSALLLHAARGFLRWLLGTLGVVAGLLILAGCSELFQPVPLWDTLSMVGNTLWSVWIVVLAVWLLVRPTHTA